MRSSREHSLARSLIALLAAVRAVRSPAAKSIARAGRRASAMPTPRSRSPPPTRRAAGVEKSAVEAARWYRKAAEQKRPDAAGALARLYVSGEIAADPEQALHWFEVEAEAGGPDVQRALAERLDRGDGVAEDPGARSSGSSARPKRARSRRRWRSGTRI